LSKTTKGVAMNTITRWDRSANRVIARWEDPQNAVSLLRSSNLTCFRLAITSKQLDAQAEAAIIESVKLENEEASQKEINRQKKEADNLEVVRQKKIKTFHP